MNRHIYFRIFDDTDISASRQVRECLVCGLVSEDCEFQDMIHRCISCHSTNVINWYANWIPLPKKWYDIFNTRKGYWKKVCTT
jgi:hypothetical protein